jgi:hypothetical protein
LATQGEIDVLKECGFPTPTRDEHTKLVKDDYAIVKGNFMKQKLQMDNYICAHKDTLFNVIDDDDDEDELEDFITPPPVV